MRFIHIADLHLGKRMNNFSLIDDQRHALNQVIAAVREEKADALIIAGDVYQNASPSAEAMALFSDFITQVSSIGVEVYVISGNHDDNTRVSMYSPLMSKAGVHLSQPFTGQLQHLSAEDDHGRVDIYMLPFIKAAHVRRLYPDERIDSLRDAMRVILANTPMLPDGRSILLCHQFITGAETCDSEEHMVGGLDNVDASLFAMFDYVALGHIHKPQRAGRDTVRYAGSLLKYSFSEAAHHKSMTLCDMGAKGDITLRKLPIIPLRDVREVEGSMADVMAMDYSEDYVHVTVTDELVPPDARISVSTVFPNLMKFSIRNSRTKIDRDILAEQSVEDKSPLELFCDFYRLQNNDTPPLDEHIALLKEIISDLEDKRQ